MPGGPLDINMGDKLLGDYDTKELVYELAKREGVEKIVYGPEDADMIGINGPMILLKIID